MKSDPKAVKTAWTVWAIFITGYLAMNYYCVKNQILTVEKLVLGFGIAMPIICNLAWWAVGFRLRLRVNHWWAFGFLTALLAGTAGFLTMLSVVKNQPDKEPKIAIFSASHFPRQ